MQFRNTYNETTKKRFYYINGKRVSRDFFETKITFCSIKNLSYNSSGLEIRKKWNDKIHKNEIIRTNFFCYD